MKLLKIIFAFIMIPFYGIFTQSYAQGCCTAGSSTFGGLERGIRNAGNLSIGFSFIRTDLNTTYNERENIPDPLNRESSVSSLHLELEYGLSQKVSLLITGGFISKNRETTVRTIETNQKEVIKFEGNGIGDVTILGKYEIITPSILSPLGLTIGGGVKLPVGSYTQEVNGSRLAIDLQPGTGSTDVLLWGNFYKGFKDLSAGFFVNTFYRYAGSNLDGYRFGDEIIFSLNGEYYFTEYLTFSISLRSRFSNEDFWGGRFLPSTGGTYYDLLPSLIYSENDYSVKAFYQTPVYRNVRGIQLTTSSILGIEFLYNIDLLN